MKKALKWLGIVLSVMVLAVLVSLLILARKADQILNTKFSVDPPVFDLPSDSASMARGKQLAVLCVECHGSKLEGYAFFKDPKLGTVYAPNLTKGKGSPTASYTDKDWIRSVRHGVRPDGRGLVIMPAVDYVKMSKQDIASLLAYVKSVEKVDHETPKPDMTLMGKVVLALGGFGDVISAEKINHFNGPAGAPPAGTSPEYGSYMVDISGCRTCHSPQMSGGKHPDPNSPPVPDLTRGGNLKNWSREQFIATMRSGKTPEGKALQMKYMPYQSFAGMSEDELTAIYHYLNSLSPGLKK